MPGRRAILPTAMFTLVVMAALSQTTRTTLAAGECLAKPNGPAPQGQHWYFRIDHANNNRQCWRLAEEGLPVRKAAPESDEAAASETEPPQQSRAPRTAIAAPAQPSTNVAPVITTNPAAAALAVPWPNVIKVPSLSQILPPALLPRSPTAPQTASADDSAPPAASDDTSAVADDPPPNVSVHGASPQQPAAEAPQSGAAPRQFAGMGQAFILLIVMFFLLAVTGPILHFTHRHRQREVVNYKPPRWAPVIPLNAAAPRVRVAQHAPDPASAHQPARRTPPQVDQAEWRPAPNLIPTPAPQPPRRPAPIPPPPPDLNEELRHVLQQLIDRIQAVHPVQSGAAASGTQRTEVRMLKKAR